MKRSRDVASDSDGEDDGGGKTAMAVAMAQLLGTRLPADKAPVLAKRKTAAMKAAATVRRETKRQRVADKTKKQQRRKHMRAPDATYRAGLERELRKVATRGVVSLLNAIRAHKKEQEQAEATKRKGASEQLKNKFLGMLKDTAGSAAGSGAGAGAGGGDAKWGVLRDDYLMGVKLKDWNRVEHERATTGAAGRGFDEEEDTAWNAAGLDALGSDSDEEEEEGGSGSGSGSGSDCEGSASDASGSD